MGPSVAGFFQGRPSQETWHSSAHPDPTSCLSDYRSSGWRIEDANEETRLGVEDVRIIK